jgi:hypothetical protein
VVDKYINVTGNEGGAGSLLVLCKPSRDRLRTGIRSIRSGKIEPTAVSERFVYPHPGIDREYLIFGQFSIREVARGSNSSSDGYSHHLS